MSRLPAPLCSVMLLFCYHVPVLWPCVRIISLLHLTALHPTLLGKPPTAPTDTQGNEIR
ncbi:hypothetical protein CCMA1212_001679 [Trichoderma ghanense]|uniref:Uncharacterized protein n=1 Tax=Trichoderma ghanense TaxID=65468 RepID=A0ABY2HFK2_9HYPO